MDRGKQAFASLTPPQADQSALTRRSRVVFVYMWLRRMVILASIIIHIFQEYLLPMGESNASHQETAPVYPYLPSQI
jgi:hypothetical protein